MIPNIHPETGIRYGIASGPEVPIWFWEEAIPEYMTTCPECGAETDSEMDCDECGFFGDPEDFCGEQPDAWVYRDKDVEAFSSDGIHVFVTRSTNVVTRGGCSPCFPNAGDLGTAGTLKCYGFPETVE